MVFCYGRFRVNTILIDINIVFVNSIICMSRKYSVVLPTKPHICEHQTIHRDLFISFFTLVL